MTALVLGIPSKGRLMEATEALLGKAGFTLTRNGSDRLYRGRLGGIEDVDVAFLSASEIATSLKEGKIDLGVTGEDLLRETGVATAPGLDFDPVEGHHFIRFSCAGSTARPPRRGRANASACIAACKATPFPRTARTASSPPPGGARISPTG